ncbi:helix-turn-helix domain-containing protein [Salipiger abyssi]|uniref:helix-turn-helix domain-containing protein n=1 Tax=Salipiger abyssi TaxID=1250539 RepID=UPI004057DD73
MANSAARQRDFDAPDGTRMLGPDEWAHQRFGWLEAVRRDADLSAQAQVVAHVLALDFANKHSVQCDPSLRQIEELTGRSRSTIKRAVAELVEAGWLTRIAGRGRGKTSGYGFLTRGRVLHLKGVKSDPRKGSGADPFSGSRSGSEKGSDLTRKGVKSDPAYNIAKPCKNHGAGARASEPVQNAVLHRDAERAVERFRDGHADALTDLKPWVISHILAADLLTPEERRAAGLC